MQLPIDIWLIICDHISDYDVLWSILRNVSQYFRACVDEYFRRAVLRETMIFPFYSTIHTCTAEKYNFLHVPMRFARLSDDGTHAVFKQAHIKEHTLTSTTAANGSLRGWVPFIERYYMETQKPGPPVIGKDKRVPGPLSWETGYKLRRKKSERLPGWYQRPLRDHTSIGRGDRPPCYIHIADLTHDMEQSELPVMTHDTELVDLAIDCPAREISLDWRLTFSAFFLERHFMALAAQSSKPRREYDRDLVSVESPVLRLTGDVTSWNRDRDDWRRARRKRLQAWVKENKKRMSKEHRLITEDAVVSMSQEQQWLLKRVVDLPDDEYMDMDEEIVPEKCAKDHRELMMWPRNKKERERAEEEAAFVMRGRHGGCVVL